MKRFLSWFKSKRVSNVESELGEALFRIRELERRTSKSNVTIEHAVRATVQKPPPHKAVLCYCCVGDVMEEIRAPKNGQSIASHGTVYPEILCWHDLRKYWYPIVPRSMGSRVHDVISWTEVPEP